MNFQVIIPARLKSSRLPGKVLLDIGGKSMVRRVYEQACRSQASAVTVATDSADVYAHVKQFTDAVILTQETHPSGTDRLAEAVDILKLPDDELIVNVQGDEPFIPPAMINQVAQLLVEHPQTVMATLCERINNMSDVFNPNIVKVIMNEKNEAQYFSRAPIPWLRGAFHYDASQMPKDMTLPESFYRHIGLYAYRAGFIKQYVQWPVAAVEQLEQLEQLRILMKGERIAISVASECSPIGVDTAADLAIAREIAAKTDI